MLGFVIWVLCGLIPIGMGIYALRSSKPVNFWAGRELSKIRDSNIKAYNKSSGLLCISYGIIFMLLGIPLLLEQNSPYSVISILGIIFSSISLIIIYLKIESKYKEK